MSSDVSQLIDAFTALAPADRHAVILEIARISQSDAGPITDDELVSAGDELFRMYDEEEAKDG